MRVGIIRCHAEAVLCNGCRCFAGVELRNHQFRKYDQIQIVGFATCGGCPGHRVSDIAHNMVRFSGAKVIHLANCILSESDLEYANMRREDLLNVACQDQKKRLNDRIYVQVRANLLANGRIPFYCKYKERFKSKIEATGVPCVLGTHGSASVLDLLEGGNDT